MELVVAVCFAVLFYMMATYEHHAGWVWALASMTVSVVVFALAGGSMALLLAHAGLFGVLWWYNAKRLDERHQEFLAGRADQQHLRSERWRRAREEMDADRARQAESGDATAAESDDA